MRSYIASRFTAAGPRPATTNQNRTGLPICSRSGAAERAFSCSSTGNVGKFDPISNPSFVRPSPPLVAIRSLAARHKHPRDPRHAAPSVPALAERRIYPVHCHRNPTVTQRWAWVGRWWLRLLPGRPVRCHDDRREKIDPGSIKFSLLGPIWALLFGGGGHSLDGCYPPIGSAKHIAGCLVHFNLQPTFRHSPSPTAHRPTREPCPPT